MSFIGRLPNFNSLTVTQEPQPETIPQQPAVQPAKSSGIASTNDGFETVNPMTSSLFGLVGEQTEILVSNQPVIAPDPTVDASMLFDYVTDVQEPAPPVPPEPTDPMSRKEFRPDPLAEAEGNESARRAAEQGARSIANEKEKEVDMKNMEKQNEWLEERRTHPWNLGLGEDIVNTVYDGMREIGLGDAADLIQDTGGDVLGIAGNAINWAGGAVVDVAKATGEAAGDAAGWTVEAAEDIAEAAAAAAEEAAKAAAKAAEDAAAAVGEAAEDVIDEVGETLEDVADAAGDVASDVGDFIGDLW